MSRTVVLVAGPPAGGKSTYVTEHAKPGDIVLDADVIGEKAMRDGLEQVARMASGEAWVIRCCPGPDQREALAQQIRATELVLLVPSEAELIARASRRPDPRRHIQAVKQWLAIEAGQARPTVGRRDPAPTPRTRW